MFLPADDEEDSVGKMIGATSDPRLRLPLQERHICKGQSDGGAQTRRRQEMMRLRARPCGVWRRWLVS